MVFNFFDTIGVDVNGQKFCYEVLHCYAMHNTSNTTSSTISTYQFDYGAPLVLLMTIKHLKHQRLYDGPSNDGTTSMHQQ